jgi:oligopeptide transport system substrate-binding protein
MTEIVRHDAPWSFGFYPKSFSLHHQWLGNVKPEPDGQQHPQVPFAGARHARGAARAWNPPVLWPIGAALVVLWRRRRAGVVIARRRERSAAL